MGRAPGNTVAGVNDTRIVQRDWNIDALKGGGRSSRNSDPARIQMAVMDHAGYGAGRARPIRCGYHSRG